MRFKLAGTKPRAAALSKRGLIIGLERVLEGSGSRAARSANDRKHQPLARTT
jgi:hypothetical protein